MHDAAPSTPSCRLAFTTVASIDMALEGQLGSLVAAAQLQGSARRPGGRGRQVWTRGARCEETKERRRRRRQAHRLGRPRVRGCGTVVESYKRYPSSCLLRRLFCCLLCAQFV
eukprot:3713834-Prymnesium_polylepis.1